MKTKVMDLSNNEIYEILRDLQKKGHNRVDIMLEDFEVSEISKDKLPSDGEENAAQLKKILMTRAAQGFI